MAGARCPVSCTNRSYSALRHRLNGDEKIVEVHFVCRPFIGVCVLGPHHEIAGWDQRKFRKKVSWHQGAVPTG